MADVFISYDRRDRAAARKLESILSQEGFTVWSDEHLRSGSVFDREIKSQLQEALCVVVLWSQNSAESDWVLNEATYALGQRKLLSVAMDVDVDFPLSFTVVHSVEMLDLEAKEAFVELPRQFRRDLRAKVEPNQVAVEEMEPEFVGDETKSNASRQTSRTSRSELPLAAQLAVSVICIFLLVSVFGYQLEVRRIDESAPAQTTPFRFSSGAETESASQDSTERQQEPALKKGSAMVPGNESLNAPSPTEEADRATSHGRSVEVPDDSSELYDTAYNDYVEGQFDLAVLGFRQYLETYPKTDQADNAAYWLGECYYRQSRFRKAIEQFDLLLDRYENSERVASALLRKGYSYLELQERAQGVVQLQKAICDHAGTDEAVLARNRLRELSIDVEC